MFTEENCNRWNHVFMRAKKFFDQHQATCLMSPSYAVLVCGRSCNDHLNCDVVFVKNGDKWFTAQLSYADEPRGHFMEMREVPGWLSHQIEKCNMSDILNYHRQLLTAKCQLGAGSYELDNVPKPH